MWVVKIGGSLSGNRALSSWLEVLVKFHSERGVIIVPGGGRFADTVRDAQQRWKFDDALAHGMALRAMEQYGMMMTGINNQLYPANDIDSIKHLANQNKISVWMPHDMSLAQTDLPQDWSITSDSLAAWLAQKICADALILIKSVRLNKQHDNIHQLSEDGVVDKHFPTIVSRKEMPAYIFHAEQYNAFKDSHEIPVTDSLRITSYK